MSFGTSKPSRILTGIRINRKIELSVDGRHTQDLCDEKFEQNPSVTLKYLRVFGGGNKKCKSHYYNTFPKNKLPFLSNYDFQVFK